MDIDTANKTSADTKWTGLRMIISAQTEYERDCRVTYAATHPKSNSGWRSWLHLSKKREIARQVVPVELRQARFSFNLKHTIDDSMSLLARAIECFGSVATALKDSSTVNYFVSYDSSNFSHVTYEIEFGIYDPDLVFMFNVYHSGYNGTIHFEFIPHNCTALTSEDVYLGFEKIGLGTGAIIALAVAGSIIVIGTVTVIIFKVVLPRRRP